MVCPVFFSERQEISVAEKFYRILRAELQIAGIIG